MTSKFQLLPADIRERINQLPEKVALLDGLIALWLFGSFARGEETPISDVDLAYLPNDALQGKTLESFEKKLYTIIANSLHTDEFSFANMRRVSPHFAFQIISEGQILFCRDGSIVSEIAESVYGRSPDIGYLRHQGNADFLEGFDMSQPTVDKERVTEFLRLINSDLRDLREKAQVARDVYLSNRDLQAIVERRLQTSTESCINIGNHIIARLGLQSPQDYGDVFRILGEHQIISLSLAEKMIDMARFRNLLVHIYWRLDHERIYDSFSDRLGALEELIFTIAHWIKQYKQENTI